MRSWGEEDPAFDRIVELSGVCSGSSEELSPLKAEVAEEIFGTMVESKKLGEGESKASSELELTSRSVVAGVCTLKPSHTSNVLS